MDEFYKSFTNKWLFFSKHIFTLVFVIFKKKLGSPTKSVKTPVEPNYSGINIEPEATKAPSKSGDIFGDLLGSQGYTFSSKFNPGPKTINEMRREDLVKEIDPEKLKVYKIFYLNKLVFFLLVCINSF